MLADGDFIALTFVLFIPLIVIVKNESDNVVKAIDEAVWRRCVDQSMEAAVQIGEVVKPCVDLGEQAQMLVAEIVDLIPKRR